MKIALLHFPQRFIRELDQFVTAKLFPNRKAAAMTLIDYATWAKCWKHLLEAKLSSEGKKNE